MDTLPTAPGVDGGRKARATPPSDASPRIGLLRNAAWNVGVGLVWSSLIVFISTRVLLTRLGPEAYGTFTVITSAVALAGLLRVGAGEATVKYVAEYRASGRQADLAGVVFATSLVYLAVSLVGWAALYLSAPWLAERVLQATASDRDSVVAAIRIAALGFPPAILTSAAVSVFAGHERYDLASAVNAGGQTVNACAGIYAALTGGTLVKLISFVVTSGWCFGLVTLVFAYRWMGAPAFRFVEVRHGIRRVLAFGLYTAVSNAATAAYSSADRLIVAAVLGTEQAAYYSVATSVASRVYTLSISTNHVLLPRFSANGLSEEGRFQSRILFWRAAAATAAMSACGTALLAGCGYDGLSLWLGARSADGAFGTLVASTIAYSLLSVIIIGYYYLNAVSRPRVAMAWYILAGACQLAGMAFLGRAFGLAGVLGGLLLFPVTLSGAFLVAGQDIGFGADFRSAARSIAGVAGTGVVAGVCGSAVGWALRKGDVGLGLRVTAEIVAVVVVLLPLYAAIFWRHLSGLRDAIRSRISGRVR